MIIKINDVYIEVYCREYFINNEFFHDLIIQFLQYT